MDNKIITFQKLANIFKNQNEELYIVGGTTRDFLMNKELTDMDLVTTAHPDKVKEILKEFKMHDKYAYLGSIKVTYEGIHFDITTLRKEKAYKDSRHPLKVTFVKDLKIDVKRRDFTINAIYMDKDLNIIDYVKGQKDLNKAIIKMVGNPYKRLKEDPLRIIRAIRFSLTYNLKIDNRLKRAIKWNKKELLKLNIDKVNQDLKKIPNVSKEQINKIFKDLSISYPLEMINL